MFIKEDARNAPVGGHTCLTAGERSEPAVVGKQLEVSIGPRRRTHSNWISEVFFLIWKYGCCGSSYGDRMGVLTDFRHSAGSFHSPAVRQVCPPTGALPIVIPPLSHTIAVTTSAQTYERKVSCRLCDQRASLSGRRVCLPCRRAYFPCQTTYLPY